MYSKLHLHKSFYSKTVLMKKVITKRPADCFKLKAAEVERRIQFGHGAVPARPFIRLKHETYVSLRKSATFIDEQYGEYSSVVRVVLSGTVHKLRSWDERRLKASDIEQRIKCGYNGVPPRPGVSIDHTTFVSLSKPATFVDEVHGKWSATPCSVMNGTNHPMRNKVRKRTPEETEQLIQATRPWLSIDKTTYKTQNTKCRFIDEVYGEWWAVPSELLARPKLNHSGRYIAKLKLSTEEINRRLACGYLTCPPRPYLQILPESYVNTDTHARFVDSEYGEWVAIPNNVLRGSNHPTRSCTWLEDAITKLVGLTRFNRVPKVMLDDGYTIKPDFQLSDDTFLEVDGLYWHSDRKTHPEKHLKRRELFEIYGYKLIQLREDEVRERPHVVQSMLHLAVGVKSSTIEADRCLVETGTRAFVQRNHIAGANDDDPIISLVHNNSSTVCAIQYKLNRDVLLVSRYCTALGVEVNGGFATLLNHVLVNTQFNGLVTVEVNLRHGTGETLTDLGFTRMTVDLDWRWTNGYYTFHHHRTPQPSWYKIYGAGVAHFQMIVSNRSGRGS